MAKGPKERRAEGKRAEDNAGAETDNRDNGGALFLLACVVDVDPFLE